MKNNKNTASTAAEYAAVKIAKDFVGAISYYNEKPDELLKAYPAFNEISPDDISDLICGCGSWSRADVMEEISFLASKVRKENFLLGTAVMVVLEKGMWGEFWSDVFEIHFDRINWHFVFPTTEECCREMNAARKRLHAKVDRPFIPYMAEYYMADDYCEPEWDM